MSINKIRATENIYTIKHINYTKLKTAADSINWNEVSLINVLNLALNNLINKIKIWLCKAKHTKKTNKNNMKPRKNWINKAIMKSCATKEKLYELWKEDHNNNRIKEEYENFTNILKNIINKAKELYDKQIESSINSPKSIWNVINQNIGKNRKRNNNINYLTDSNKKISDPVKITEHLTNFSAQLARS